MDTPTPTIDPSTPGGGWVDPVTFCEPNEGISSAPLIGNGTYTLAILSGDVDWFQIHAAGNTPLTIRIEFQHSSGDLELEIYNDQNTMVAHSWGTSDFEEVTHTPGSPSTYYARVLGYQGAGGSYNLLLSGVDPQVASAGEACPEIDASSEVDNLLGDLAYSVNFDGTGPNYGAEITDASANSAVVTSDQLWMLGPDPWMPPGGHSEPTAVITVPFGDYPNNGGGYLSVGPFDLSQVTSARMDFNLYYDIESDYDGLVLLATIDNGNNWSLLTPDQGYPGNSYLFGGPAYSGFIPNWQAISVDLNAHLSQNTQIVFYFQSDAWVTAPGAAVDDIAIWINGPSSAPVISPIESLTLPLSPDDLQLVDPDWLPKQPRFVAESNLNCRDGNHTSFAILTQLGLGSSAPVKAVNPERTWYYVLHPDRRIFCWVWHEGGRIVGDELALPELPNFLPEIEGSEDDTEPGLPAFCMVSPGGSAAPECKPCFEGATPGDACTP